MNEYSLAKVQLIIIMYELFIEGLITPLHYREGPGESRSISVTSISWNVCP